jgi:hypothetical protein
VKKNLRLFSELVNEQMLTLTFSYCEQDVSRKKRFIWCAHILYDIHIHEFFVFLKKTRYIDGVLITLETSESITY